MLNFQDEIVHRLVAYLFLELAHLAQAGQHHFEFFFCRVGDQDVSQMVDQLFAKVAGEVVSQRVHLHFNRRLRNLEPNKLQVTTIVG